MTNKERELLLNVATGLAAVIEALADGEGLHAMQEIRGNYRERCMVPIIKLEQTVRRAMSESAKDFSTKETT